MKKTMFITSVIMVIVMAVALTTSSLAWFSVNGSPSVTTDTLKVTAQAEGSTGIGISHDGVNNWGSELALASGANVSTNLMPLVPFAKDGAASEAKLLAALVGGTEAKYIAYDAFYADMLDYYYKTYTSGTPANTYKAVRDAGEEKGISLPEGITALDDVYQITDSTSCQHEDNTGIDLDAKGNRIALTSFDTTIYAYYKALHDAGLIGDVGSNNTNSAQNSYDAYMIGAKIDGNKNFAEGAYRDHYYTDTFYIKNLAAGVGAEIINLKTEITFWFNGVVESSGAYTYSTEKTKYCEDYRKAEKYRLDPTLCVAVIMRTNSFLSDAAYIQSKYYPIANYNSEAARNKAIADRIDAITAMADPTAADTAEKAALEELLSYYTEKNWEIVAYAESKGEDDPAEGDTPYWVSSLNMGKESVDFVNGKASASSTATLNTAKALNRVNSLDLQGEHSVRYLQTADADPEVDANWITEDRAADVLEVKVVAWYDATTLDNNNSSSSAADSMNRAIGTSDLMFELKFTKQAN